MSDADECLILFSAKRNILETLFVSSCFLAETVPNAFPRRLSWELQGQQECVDILVSAWNSAGEGPKGKPATCCCPSRLLYQTGSYKTRGAFPYEIDEKDQRSLQ